MTGLTMSYDVRFERGRRGKSVLKEGIAAPLAAAPARIPRVARLMALAIRLDDLIRRGEIRDYAEIARLGHVTRARVTQIMALINLAPDLQEYILAIPTVQSGRDRIAERHLRPLSAVADWQTQRNLWKDLAIRLGNANEECTRASCRLH